MAFVASELEREGFTQPLLIGGATTSAGPHRGAHRAGLPGAGGARAGCLARGGGGQQPPERRAPRRIRGGGPRGAGAVAQGAQPEGPAVLRPIAEAGGGPPASTWPTPPPKPAFVGLREFEDYPLEELVPRIDWTPFFQAWELKGLYPDILEDPVTGAAARELLADAQAHARRHRARPPARGARRAGVLPGGARRRRRHRSLRGRIPARGARRDPHPAAADGQGRRPAQPGAGRLRGPAPTGAPDYLGPSR